MSLDFTFTQIEDYKNRCWVKEGDKRKVHPDADHLIWLTMTVGLNTVSDNNIDEWLKRIALLKVCRWSIYHDGDGNDLWPDRAMLERFVGLSTNASRITWAQFRNRFIERRVQEQLEADEYKAKGGL